MWQMWKIAWSYIGSGGLRERRYNKHIKFRNSVADSTIPETVVLRTLSQAPLILARRIMRLSVPWISLTKPLILDFYATSRAFFPPCRSSLRVRMWSALENPPPPVTARSSSALPRMDRKYFSWADVTGFRGPSPYFLTGIVIRDPTTKEIIFVFPNKRREKNVSWSIFFTHATASPMYHVTCCRNIHSDLIAHATAA